MAGSSSNRFLNEAIELALNELRKGEFFELICALEQSTEASESIRRVKMGKIRK